MDADDDFQRAIDQQAPAESAYWVGLITFSDGSNRRVASADFSRVCRAHRNKPCTRITSGDRPFDWFRESNLITRQAALVRRHLVAHGDARVLVFR